MNYSRLATILGLIAGTAELTARSGVLGDRAIFADGVASVAIALLGLFTNRVDSPKP
jgi:hypothetical protein